jgi:AcrR family transcriptional regulator
MPKDTFLNLPEEKRAHIERVAMEEFADHGYDNASITRIV